MKATVKQVVAMLSGLENNLPQNELNDLEFEEVQAITDNLHAAGIEFMRFLKNRARVEIVYGEHVVDCAEDPFLPESWQGVEEHQKKMGRVKLERRGDDLYANDKKIELFLSESQASNKCIEGNKLRKKLANKSVLNANVLDRLLAHPELIPDSWKGKYVFFWGTIYRDLDGRLFVRYLCWHDDEWGWRYGWLDYDFGSDDPAAVSASQALGN